MKIGLPQALLYHRYGPLWETFFKELGCEIVLSGESDPEILADGVNFSIDECCLPAKIYMGHVNRLIGRCDYILVPRVHSFGKRESTCVKFDAMYDIVKNTFRYAMLLDYDLDVYEGKTEAKGFAGMGKTLGFGYRQSLLAYQKAKKAQEAAEKQKTAAQLKLLQGSGLKILIAAHPYNTYDKLIGRPITDYIKKLGAVPIYADGFDKKECAQKATEISEHLYWTYNKELVGAIAMYKDRVDGIILLTAFPCGPDSLVNELLIRKLHGVPVSNIILDGLQGEAGLETRIESFIDIIEAKRKVKSFNE